MHSKSEYERMSMVTLWALHVPEVFRERAVLNGPWTQVLKRESAVVKINNNSFICAVVRPIDELLVILKNLPINSIVCRGFVN